MLKVTKIFGELPNTRFKNGKLYRLLSWNEDEKTIEGIASHAHGDKLILLSTNGMYGLYTRG